MLNVEKYRDELLNNYHNNGDTLVPSLALFNAVSACYDDHACSGDEWPGANTIVEWLFEKYQESILDDVEREWLSNIVKPFKVKWIKLEKEVDTDNTFLIVAIQQFDGFDEEWDLPTFKKDTMYKGMKLGRRYTLKELGLC